MGTDIELMGIDVPEAVLAEGETTIRDLERHWSRFLPSSDLCRLNAAGGAPVILPAITYDLVAEALAWSDRTGGWFDPTILAALEAAGYDRSFEVVDPDGRTGRGDAAVAAGPGPGPGAVTLEPALRSVRLAPGVRLDLGGIGKGRAADLVAERFRELGHAGCANLGGDLRAVGRGPDGAWSIGVDDPSDAGRDVAVVGIVDGAVATSSTVRRTWTRGGVRMHHLIDPATGRPSAHPPGSVTVVAGTAVEAEVWAKAALLAGPRAGPALLAAQGLPALFVDPSGSRPVNGMEAYVW